jgi:hypothetical protein
MENKKIIKIEITLIIFLFLGIIIISGLMFYENKPELDYIHNTTITNTIIYQKNVSFACPNVTCEKTFCPDVFCETPTLSVFEKVIRNNAEEHSYELDDYDCTEFSKELDRRLRENGWRSNWIQRVVDCERSDLFDFDSCDKYNGRHDLVVVYDVYIEAVTGKIISPQNYESYGII